MTNDDSRWGRGAGDQYGPGPVESRVSGAGAGGDSRWGASPDGGFGTPYGSAPNGGKYGAPSAGPGHDGRVPVGAPVGGPPGGPVGGPGGGAADDGGGKKAKGIGALGIAALMLGSAAVGGATAAVITNGSSGGGSSSGSDSNVTNALEEPGAARSEPAPEGSIEAAAQAALDSVVSIQVVTDRGTGSGSGSVLSSDGLVLTNQHVVAEADQPGARMSVLLNDGTTHSAQYVAGHGPSDIAVIRVEGVNNLRPISLGDSSKVSVGQEVVAVGSPLGLTSTVTSGIVSALNRPVGVSGAGGESTVIDAIQTDAAINPGNSGGPLIDGTGAVIGINTSIFSQTGGSIGLGFAIPVNDVRNIATELMTEGSIQHATIGVNARKADNGAVEGAEVVNVREDSPAQEGGLREGDVVTKVGERQVRSSDELVVAVRRAGADTDVPVEVIRDGTKVELTVRPVLE